MEEDYPWDSILIHVAYSQYLGQKDLVVDVFFEENLDVEFVMGESCSFLVSLTDFKSSVLFCMLGKKKNVEIS